MVNQLEAAEGEKSEELLRRRSIQWKFIFFKESMMLQLVSDYECFIHGQKKEYWEIFCCLGLERWLKISQYPLDFTGRMLHIPDTTAGRKTWRKRRRRRSGWCGQVEAVKRRVCNHAMCGGRWGKEESGGECEGCREGERQGKGGRVSEQSSMQAVNGSC